MGVLTDRIVVIIVPPPIVSLSHPPTAIANPIVVSKYNNNNDSVSRNTSGQSPSTCFTLWQALYRSPPGTASRHFSCPPPPSPLVSPLSRLQSLSLALPPPIISKTNILPKRAPCCCYYSYLKANTAGTATERPSDDTATVAHAPLRKKQPVRCHAPWGKSSRYAQRTKKTSGRERSGTG